MSPAAGLSVVLAAFVALMTMVIVLAFRERRAARRIDATDVAAQNASDARMLVGVFGGILGGMLLTVVAAVLVFF